MKFDTLDRLVQLHEDTPECQQSIQTEFLNAVNNEPLLKGHRDWIENNRNETGVPWGYGDRQFGWMWNLIVKQLPEKFSFVEIGVYRGQILTLIDLLADRYDKAVDLYGVSPLDGVEMEMHGENHFVEDIAVMFDALGADIDNLLLIEGYSENPKVIEATQAYAPFDVLYIDGGHSYETVKSDILGYKGMIKRGGLLIIDDASCFLNFTDEIANKGIIEVTQAVEDHLVPDLDFLELFNVGHNRVWRKND